MILKVWGGGEVREILDWEGLPTYQPRRSYNGGGSISWLIDVFIFLLFSREGYSISQGLSSERSPD